SNGGCFQLEHILSDVHAILCGWIDCGLAILSLSEIASGARKERSRPAAGSISAQSGGKWTMSEAAAAMHAGVEPQETPLTPESWGKLGMWLFLAGDAMSFGCLIVGYGILRHASSKWPVPKDVLGINLTAFMTFLLIVSSVTMVLSLSA